MTSIAAPGAMGSPSSGAMNSGILSDWAAPYVTQMLGQTQALAAQPYQVYQGPMTAGESGLQSNVFKGLGSLNFPSQLGQSFSSTGAYQLPNMGPNANQPMGGAGSASRAAPTESDWQRTLEMAQFAPGTDMAKAKADFMSGGGKNLGGPEMGAYNPAGNMPTGSGTLGAAQTSMPPQGIASQYMNPYLQSVLTPQLDELRRQNDITNMGANAKLTQAGAFGGGRQAIMNAENNRNLMMEQNKTVGQGYANAYDKAMQQYNTEQGQAKGLAELMAQQGASQRGIEQEGITADLNEFNAQRDYPQKMLQFQQSMLQGLPVQSVQNTAGSLSGLGTLLAGLGGGAAVASNLGYKDVGQLLKGFGLDLGPAP